jgi:isoquinoline 1-oxidoreductase beta subunit
MPSADRVSALGPLGRRAFLKVGAAAGGGLLVGVVLPRLANAADSTAASVSDPQAVNLFVAVWSTGRVTVTIPRPEMGQRTRTSLAMLVAEELDVPWSSVDVVQADLDTRLGDQYAGGSSSVHASWSLLRQAGAGARVLLRRAAAKNWDVPESECETAEGRVRHARSGRVASYGALAQAASRLSLGSETPPLKNASAYRLIGKRVRQQDVDDITHGRIRFGIDVQVPGMLYAVIERAPEFDARPVTVDDAAARRSPGVKRVEIVDADGLPEFDENSPKPASGVAVIADSTWAAMRGRKALSITWSKGEGATESTAAMRERSVALHERAPHWVIRRDGDPDGKLAGAAKVLEAEYEVPLVAHATMEPMNCTAKASADGCEVWAPTQNPGGVRDAVSRTLGVKPEQVTVHVMRMGGGFGRRFYSDFAAEAALLSRKAGAPVKVVWTREDDMRHGFFRPAGVHRLRAGLDASGRPIAWMHALVNASRGHYLRWKPMPGQELQPGELDHDDFPSHFIDDLQLGYSTVASPIPRGQWRAVEDSATVFVVQGFLDELAHAAGRDPLAFRIDLLGTPRAIPYGGGTYDSGRLAAVLKLAAEKAGWGSPVPQGVGRGLACSYANHSYTAEVADVTVSPQGEIRLLRVVAAVDCGRVVNPDGAASQVEGAIIYGGSAALFGEITVERGGVVQGSFDDYPVLRIDAAPKIEVHFIEGEEAPTGLGETPLPPLAPAVANAVFACTGKRIRKLPLKIEA